MIRAMVCGCALLLALLAWSGCGSTREVREPDLVVASSPEGTPAGQTEGVGATVHENDADAAAQAVEPTTDAEPVHAPETQAEVEEKIEAAATEDEKTPATDETAATDEAPAEKPARKTPAKKAAAK